MKRLLILALIACLTLSLCACASSDAPATDPTTTPTSAPSTPSTPSDDLPENPTEPEADELKVEGVWAKDGEHFCLVPGGIAYITEWEEILTYSWELNGNVLRVFDADTEYFTVDIEVQDVATRICAMKDFDLASFDPVGVWTNDSLSMEFYEDTGDVWGATGMYDDGEDFYWSQDGYCIKVDMKGDPRTYYILGDCLCSAWGDVYNRAD